MFPLISIIIPVKNGANYIKQALEAIHKQNVNKEIIIVDDGSTDSSGSICDRYASQDSRITVVHQKNQGAGVLKTPA